MTTTWQSYRGGKRWLVEGHRIACQGPPHADARLTATQVGRDGDGIGERLWYRTKGDPSTMRQLWRDYGLEIAEAAERFRVPRPWIMGLIGIEAARLKQDRGRFDPRSRREEPGYRSDETTPNKVSPGLMQTLLSTARGMEAQYTVMGHPITAEDLCVPRYSILLGTCYVRHQMDRREDDEPPGDDPVLNACAAYNAGSVRYDASNDWHLLTYGQTRTDRFVAWVNDSVAVLEELGIGG